jgi:hypothetical protein
VELINGTKRRLAITVCIGVASCTTYSSNTEGDHSVEHVTVNQSVDGVIDACEVDQLFCKQWQDRNS